MMADMQMMADQLPPGIFLQILRLMSQLDMEDMMFLHQQIHMGDLLQQPRSQILTLYPGTDPINRSYAMGKATFRPGPCLAHFYPRIEPSTKNVL